MNVIVFYVTQEIGSNYQGICHSFCESFNKFFPNYGSDQIEFATAEFLNPFTKGSRLRLNKFQSTVEHICNVLQSTADQQEEESQSNIDVGGPSQVLK
jgi:hypothetical protein